MRLRFKANLKLPAYQDAAEWLAVWLEASWKLDPKYRDPRIVSSILEPLFNLAPYTAGPSQPMYRIIGSDQNLVQVQIPGNTLLSCTVESDPDFWRNLADAIGAFEFHNTYVIQMPHPQVLLDTKWIVEQALPILKDNCEDQAVSRLTYFAESYLDQGEVLAYLDQPRSVNILQELKW